MTEQVQKTESLILVEAPAWGDAKFYAQWLLDAAKANDLLHQAQKEDPEFRERIETLEVLHCLDFGIMATVFLSQMVGKYYTFVVDTNSWDANDFVLMAEMGFFTLTGDRYQMTLPTNLDIVTVKKAHLKLADTEDKHWIHPERLFVAMPKPRAQMYQRLLGKIGQAQRLADRKALLFLD
jgi:hypothetical protein